jgi:uncharacterized protein
MNTYLIVPGLGNSGEGHWQTLFEQTLENCRRIQQKEWNAPCCDDWLENIDDAVLQFPLGNVVLIGHSLACTTIAHWATKFGRKIKGALLVAPSDLDAPAYTFPATGFTPIPLQPIPFKTIVVASSNDPWVSIERAKYFADSWGSEFVNIGDAGHINVAGGYGEWKTGLQLLKRF